MSLFARLSNAGQGHALNKSDKQGTTPNSISSVPDIHSWEEEIAQVQLKTLKPGDIDISLDLSSNTTFLA